MNLTLERQNDEAKSADPASCSEVGSRTSHPEREDAREGHQDAEHQEEEGWEAWAGRKICATAAEFYDDAKEFAEAVTTGFCLLTLMDELATGANSNNSNEKQLTLNLELDKQKQSENQNNVTSAKSVSGLGKALEAKARNKNRGKLRLNTQTVIIDGEHFAVEAEIDENTRKGWVMLNKNKDGNVTAKVAS
mmetsp:Transcript_14764/g.28047  ORF Transcript_14764/g.28047 Transcript_14764/m.28047 type:complete len:192 (-) Transcript_14764:406-981(-)